MKIEKFLRLLLLLSLLSASCVHDSKKELAQCATLLSQKTPTLQPEFFECEKESGRYGIWTSAEKPRYTGAAALVSLEDTKLKKKFILMTFQQRLIKGQLGLYAEGPAGGFENEVKENKNLFYTREKLLYEDFLKGKTSDHKQINHLALTQTNLKEAQETDVNSYRTAVREGYEETGVSALIQSSSDLQKAGINRQIKLLRLYESNRYIFPMYHIHFSCHGCYEKNSLLIPRSEPTEEVVAVQWIPSENFKRKDSGEYVVIPLQGEDVPMKPSNGWNEACDEFFEIKKSFLSNLTHEIFIN